MENVPSILEAPINWLLAFFDSYVLPFSDFVTKLMESSIRVPGLGSISVLNAMFGYGLVAVCLWVIVKFFSPI